MSPFVSDCQNKLRGGNVGVATPPNNDAILVTNFYPAHRRESSVHFDLDLALFHDLKCLNRLASSIGKGIVDCRGPAYQRVEAWLRFRSALLIPVAVVGPDA